MEYQLSKRLLFIASFVTSDMRIGDVGSDHGYLPYYLLNEGKVNYAYACDNKKGPFENLSLTFKDKFNGKIHLALKDGLSDLPNEVNTLILSGMGGDLITSILQKGEKYLSHIDKMILSPQQNVEGLRRYLNSIHYQIVNEAMVYDDKYYFVLIVNKGEQILTDFEYKYGPYLIKNKDDTFIAYLKETRNYYKSILEKKNLNKEKITYLNSEIDELNTLIG